MRLLLVCAASLLTACAPPKAEAPSKPDLTKEAWYGHTVEQLTVLNREAEDLLRRSKPGEAAANVTKGQPLVSQLLAVPLPTQAAMEAASDLDDLHARMLLANRHYGWARLLFQKNAARWKNWKPQTPETARRQKLAESGITQCDRRLAN